MNLWVLMILFCQAGSSFPSNTTKPRSLRRICSCGKRGPPPLTTASSIDSQTSPPKIYGGEESIPGEWPWMAALKYNGETICGATLINEHHALTAAHCVTSLKRGRYKLSIRDHNIVTNDEINHRGRIITKIIKNKDYNVQTDENDIAILRFEPAVQFVEDNIEDGPRPVCLPQAGNPYSNRESITMGWGVQEDNPFQSEVLYHVNVTTLSHRQCSSKTNYKSSRIKKVMICAGTKGKDSCQGDSGGPLVTKSESGYYEQIGIVSFGTGCGRKGFPGVYTRVNKYLTWIKKNAPGNNCS